MDYRRADDQLFGKYCYIDTPWIAGKKTIYRIIRSGVRSNTWCEVPVSGRTKKVNHGRHSEEIVFVVLDTLIDEHTEIMRFALKDVKIIETSEHKDEPFDKDTNVRSNDEPQRDCFLCKWLGDVDVCGRCRNRNLFAEADTEPQTERCPHCGDGVITKGQTTCPLCGEPIEQTDCAWK